MVVAAVLLLMVGATIVITNPFAGEPALSGIADNGAPTALQVVRRRSLTARQTVVGTLGYAETWTVAVPNGTSTPDLEQAGQQEASARANLLAVGATLEGDQKALDTGGAELQAARLKEESDCKGSSAAASPAPSTGASGGEAGPATGGSSCASSMQAAAEAQATMDAAQQKVVSDRVQLVGVRDMLVNAQRALNAAQAASPAYGSSGIYTTLPTVGDVVRRGQVLYAIDGVDVLLFYGRKPAWRSFASGMRPGRDVAELNANLRALGFGAPLGEAFTNSTAQAITDLQRVRGLPLTGALLLGAVVFEPSAARVTAVTPTAGQGVQAGPIMTLSSTKHDVSVQLDPSEQSQVKVGDPVLVTLPDNSTTPGVVVSVGNVATMPAPGQSNAGSGSPSSPTIPIDVRLLHPRNAGTLDQAPVNVLITTANVRSALVVPVNALVALAGGGYALEEVTANGTHQLVPVTPGLFDDEAGLVQVSGRGVVAGQRVVVPTSQ
jgi:hypothetical protein